MKTLFSDIYITFLSKIKDYSLLSLDDIDKEELMEKYLKSAIPKFKYCVKSLAYNDELKQFNEELTQEEIEILATLMTLNWLSPVINNQALLKEKFGSREFNIFSSSALLKEIKDLRREIIKEVNELMTIYYYTN